MFMPDGILCRRAGLPEAESGDEPFALHIEPGSGYGLDETATRVRKPIDRPRRLSGLSDLLRRKFDVRLEQCERDPGELLSDLEKDALVSIEAPAL